MNALPKTPLPPNMGPADRVVLFDGVCKLCSAWANFLIRFDKRRACKLATVQSPEGQAILSWHGLPTASYDTMVFAEGPRLFTKSTAFLRVMRCLPFPWPLVSIGLLAPRVVRDWFYDRVARNRYKLFGKFETCLLPTPDHEGRFLKSGSGL